MKKIKSIVPLFCFLLLTMLLPAADYFAATNGNDSSDGLSWSTAWKTLTNAAAMATNSGDTVTFSNGTYTVSTNVIITNGVTFRSTNGYSSTTIRGSGAAFRMFQIKTNAVLDGFTVTCGKYLGNDTGLICLEDGATLANCYMQVNTSKYGTVFMTDALVRNCIIRANSSTYAGAIWIQTPSNFPGPQGYVENCTIYDNTANAGGVYAGGIIFRYNRGVARNCIVYGNTNVGGGALNWGNTANAFEYSCTTPNPGGAGIVTNDPRFANVAITNLHLASDSPCRNSGTNLPWMVGAYDLDGNSRIVGNRVDMGAYEYIPPCGAIFVFY